MKGRVLTLIANGRRVSVGSDSSTGKLILVGASKGPSWMRDAFMLRFLLPFGFPESVTPDYVGHQLWTFVKNTASASCYVLSTHSLLSALGVASGAEAFALSAAANWVLKDGLGAAGVMYAAGRFGRAMDSHLRTSRWLAEAGMVLGTGLEMVTPLLPPWAFLPSASIANTMKGLGGLANGASKAAFHRHFARDANLADVTAKSHSQNTAAYLIGTGIGVVFSLLTGGGAAFAWVAFALLSAVQMVAVRIATSSVALANLDSQRGPMLVKRFLAGGSLPSPDEMRSLERFEWPFAFSRPYPYRVVLGASPLVFRTESALAKAIAAAGPRRFLVHYEDGARKVHVVLRTDATEMDMVQAMFEAHCVVEKNSANFEGFVSSLKEKGWELENTAFESASSKVRCDW